MSYGANIPHGWRQAGVYVGLILRGAKPAELPVVQSVKLERAEIPARGAGSFESMAN
jgi:hypothetical protein